MEPEKVSVDETRMKSLTMMGTETRRPMVVTSRKRRADQREIEEPEEGCEHVHRSQVAGSMVGAGPESPASPARRWHRRERSPRQYLLLSGWHCMLWSP